MKNSQKRAIILDLANTAYSKLKNMPVVFDMVEIYKTQIEKTQKDILSDDTLDHSYFPYLQAFQKIIREQLGDTLANVIAYQKSVYHGLQGATLQYQRDIALQGKEEYLSKYPAMGKKGAEAQGKILYSDKEKIYILEAKQQGKLNEEIAESCNTIFHNGSLIRTGRKISDYISKINQKNKKYTNTFDEKNGEDV